MERKVIQLTSNDFTGYTNPIEILPSIGDREFYDVLKVVWKYRFNTIGYNYTGKILFKVGHERFCTLQSDSLSSTTSTASVSNANICVDKDCPYLTLGDPITMILDGSPPTTGDGEVQIDIYYYLDSVDKNWDS